MPKRSISSVNLQISRNYTWRTIKQTSNSIKTLIKSAEVLHVATTKSSGQCLKCSISQQTGAQICHKSLSSSQTTSCKRQSSALLVCMAISRTIVQIMCLKNVPHILISRSISQKYSVCTASSQRLETIASSGPV